MPHSNLSHIHFNHLLFGEHLLFFLNTNAVHLSLIMAWDPWKEVERERYWPKEKDYRKQMAAGGLRGDQMSVRIQLQSQYSKEVPRN